MPLNRYVIVNTVTLPAGTATFSSNGYGGTSYSQGPGLYGSAPGTTYVKGQVIVADPAGTLFAAIGAANLRAYVQGQDDSGHAALSNLCADLRDRAISASSGPAAPWPAAACRIPDVAGNRTPGGCVVGDAGAR
jgi:hypothetical protein